MNSDAGWNNSARRQLRR